MKIIASVRGVSVAMLVLASAALTPLFAKPIAPAGFPHIYDKEFAMSTYRPAYRTVAQALVDDLPRRYPDIEYGVLHALLPDGKAHAVIASHRPAQVGAIDILGDNEISDHQLIEINPRMKEGFARTVIIMPLKNAAGQYIKASCAFYFYTYPTDDVRAVFAKAIEIRDDLAKSIPDLESLYLPAK